MISTALFLGLMLFAALPGMDSTLPPDNPVTCSTFCNHELPTEAFAATFYAAMVVEHGFDVVAKVQSPGTDAAKTEYNTVFKILSAEGLCDADWVAFTASTAMSKIDVIHLTVFLENTGHTVGKFLTNIGLLDCSTAIPLAFEYYKFVKNSFTGLDQNQVGSYMHAAVQGLLDFVLQHGLDLDDSSKSLAFIFYKQFSALQNKCPVSETIITQSILPPNHVLKK